MWACAFVRGGCTREELLSCTYRFVPVLPSELALPLKLLVLAFLICTVFLSHFLPVTFLPLRLHGPLCARGACSLRNLICTSSHFARFLRLCSPSTRLLASSSLTAFTSHRLYPRLIFFLLLHSSDLTVHLIQHISQVCVLDLCKYFSIVLVSLYTCHATLPL